MTPLEALLAARDDEERVVLEGFHALKHAARFDAAIEHVLVGDTHEVDGLVAALAPDLPGRLAVPPTVCSPEQWAAVAPPRLPSPVLAVARRPTSTVADVLAAPGPVVLLDRPRHLGNLGATVRVAAAAGVAGVLVVAGVDPWHPAAVRGAAGLQFALRVASAVELPPLGVRRLVAVDPGGAPLGDHGPGPADVLAFGSERHGLTAAVRGAADATVAIPMRPGVSSLNLATAVAVTLYAGRWAPASA